LGVPFSRHRKPIDARLGSQPFEQPKKETPHNRSAGEQDRPVLNARLSGSNAELGDLAEERHEAAMAPHAIDTAI
jgi:hypothetical protein